MTFDLYELTCERWPGDLWTMWTNLWTVIMYHWPGDIWPIWTNLWTVWWRYRNGLSRPVTGAYRADPQTEGGGVQTCSNTCSAGTHSPPCNRDQIKSNTILSSLNGINVCIKSWDASLAVSKILLLIFHSWILFGIITNVKTSRFYFLASWYKMAGLWK